MHFDLRKFEEVAKFVAPLILASVGVPPAATALVVNGIVVAEHISNGDPKTGEEKKQIAMDAVLTGLSAVNEAKPGTVDITQVMSTVSDGIDLTVKAIKTAKNIPVKPAL